MKALTIVIVLQALVILALVGHSFRDTSQGVTVSPSERAVAQATPAVAAHVGNATEAADEQRLRQVIREELARLQNQPHVQGGVASPAVAARPRNDLASRDERDSVAQRIENYRAAGSLTDAQMLELQAAIVRLDDGSRKQMMSRLIRAWKAGEISGRL